MRDSEERIFQRNSWHPIGRRGTLDRTAKTRGFVHHSAGTFGKPSREIDTFSECVAVMRDIDEFHTHGKGWAGIAYNYLVFQPRGKMPVRIFKGRGSRYIPAAQLDDNTGTIAVCVIDGNAGEPLKHETIEAIAWLFRHLKHSAHPSLVGLGGHRDARNQSTECPGRFITPHLDEIAHKAGLRRIHA